MLDSTPDNETLFRVPQIIIIAMASGVIIFAIAAAVVFGPENGENGDEERQSFVSYIALGFAVVVAILRGLIGAAVTRSHLQTAAESWDSLDENSRTRQLLAGYQTRLIVESALLEAVAFFAITAYIIDGQLWILGIVVAVVALMLIAFPTRSKIESWIADQRKAIEAEQAFS